MKNKRKALPRLLLLALAGTLLLTIGCEAAGNDNSSEPSSQPDDSSGEQSEQSADVESSVAEESSEEPSEASEAPSEEPSESEPEESHLTAMYCSYDQRPYAVIVGACNEGAIVHASLEDGQEIDSESFYGWYSVRYKYTSGASVTLTQTVDGKQVGNPLVYKRRPNSPDSSEGIIAGSEYQFFYSKCLADFQRANLPSHSELSSLTLRIKNRIKAIENAGLSTKLVYIIAPSAMSVYPERVPDMYESGSGRTRRQLIMDALSEAGATVIDLDSAFAEHKNDTQTLFYRTDSHWTEYAAFIAYTELFNVIKNDFPIAAPLPYDSFNWYSGLHKTGDMLNYLKMTSPVYLKPGFSAADCLEYSWFRDLSTDVTGVARKRFDETGVYSEEVTYKNTVNTGREAYPNCIVMRDSYGTQLNDLIAGNMNTTYYQTMWDYTYSLNNIKRYSADYVIYILSEWNCFQAMNN